MKVGGLSEPFKRYDVHNHEPFPEEYAGTCRTYASLITLQIRQLDALTEDSTLAAGVITGPTKLYRVINSRKKRYEPQDLRRGTSYFGDWWFGKDLLEDCLQYCRAIVANTARNPLTDMTLDRCLRTQLRCRSAIRIDWNAVVAFRELTLQPNEAIPVIKGIGLPKRIYSSDADRHEYPGKDLPAAAQLLPGGDPQFWIPWTP